MFIDKIKKNWDWAIGEKIIQDVFDLLHRFKNESIAEIGGLTVSLDGEKVATRVEMSKKGIISYTIVVNNKIWKERFNDIDIPVFSYDGKDIFVMAERTKAFQYKGSEELILATEKILVINDNIQEEPIVDSFGFLMDNFAVSPNGKKIAIITLGPCCICRIHIADISDNKLRYNSKQIEETGFGPLFSPDNKKLIFTDSGNIFMLNLATGKKTIIADQKFWGECFKLETIFSRPIFSSDSQKIAFIIRKQFEIVEKTDGKITRSSTEYGKSTVSICNTPWKKEFVHVTDLSFDSSGKKLAITVEIEPDKFTIVVDDKNFWKKRFSYASGPIFSPNGKNIAAIIKTGIEKKMKSGEKIKIDKYTIAINDQIWCKGLEKNFSEIFKPLTFSPDGKKILVRAKSDMRIHRIVLPIKEVLKKTDISSI